MRTKSLVFSTTAFLSLAWGPAFGAGYEKLAGLFCETDIVTLALISPCYRSSEAAAGFTVTLGLGNRGSICLPGRQIGKLETQDPNQT